MQSKQPKFIANEKFPTFPSFQIFFIGPNQKLGNLGKFSFTSSFDSSCNLNCKSDKKLTETKT